MKTLKQTDIGLGLRIGHYQEIFSTWPEVDFFEIISENFMVEGGLPLVNLDRALERYTLVQHGVSLNIASQDPLNWDYLKKLKALTLKTKTPFVTDHLCWTGSHGHNLHDLLPFPYTDELIKFIAHKARIVQDYLELPLGLENLSSYVSFSNSTMNEWEFYQRVVEEAGCYYMCDINNIYVSSVNHQFDPKDYIDGLDWTRVLQCHIAGHSELANGTIIDTHDHPVRKEVWDLYQYAWKHSGGFPTLLEWDDQLISFKDTHAEALKAREFQVHPDPGTQVYQHPSQRHSPQPPVEGLQATPPEGLSQFQNDFSHTMSQPFIFLNEEKQSFGYNKSEFKESIVQLMVDRDDLKGIDRLCTYNQQYWFRLLSTFHKQYPMMTYQLGHFRMNQLVTQYLHKYPSTYPSMDHLDDYFPQFIREDHPWNTELHQALVDYDFIYSKNFTAAQKTAFQPQQLLPEQLIQLAQTKLHFQPSFSLYSSQWNLERFRSELLAGSQPSIEEFKDRFHIAIYRAHNIFKHTELHPVAYKLIQGLHQGMSLELVIDQLSQTLNEEDIEYLGSHIQSWFAEWTQWGWFILPTSD